MISRTWHGLVPKDKADGFAAYLNETGVYDARRIPGNAAAYVHRVDQGAYAHFFLCTVWASMEAIKAFAGLSPDIAVTYPEDAAFGLVSDPIVIHQEVAAPSNPFKPV